MNAMLTTEGEQYRIDAVRDWLEKVRKTVGYQRTLEQSAADRLARADGLKGLDYSKEQVKSSPYADAIPDAIAANEVIGDALQSVAEDARERVAQAARAIASLDDANEARCLHLYYIEAYDTWERVCVAMHYSYDWIMKLRRNGLLHLYDEMPHYMKDRPSRATPGKPLPEGKQGS